MLYIDHTPHSPQKSHEMYIHIKQIEEKLLPFIIHTSTLELQNIHANMLHLINDSILAAITSSKYLKDIQHHLINLKDESVGSELAARSLHFFQKILERTSGIIVEVKNVQDTQIIADILETEIKTLHIHDDEFLQSLSKDLQENDLNTLHISEIIKTNRYVLLSCEELLE